MAELLQEKFKRGDVVRLKSGSSKMTVNLLKYQTDLGSGNKSFLGTVSCAWEDDNKQQHISIYHQDSLELAGN